MCRQFCEDMAERAFNYQMGGLGQARPAPTTPYLHSGTVPVATYPTPGGPLITHGARFLSEEKVYIHYLVRPWATKQYDMRLRELMPLFSGGGDLYVSNSGRYNPSAMRRDELVISLPQVNEILRENWEHFSQIRRDLLQCDLQGIPIRDANGNVQRKRSAILPESSLARIDGNLDAFVRMMNTPVYMWFRDPELSAFITKSFSTRWLTYATAEGIRKNLAFLGIFSNRLGHYDDDTKPYLNFAGHRSQLVANVQVDGPGEMFNFFGYVSEGMPLRFLLTRRFDGVNYHEFCVLPWGGNTGSLIPFSREGTDQERPFKEFISTAQYSTSDCDTVIDPGYLLFPDATEKFTTVGSWWEVGRMMEQITSSVPSADARAIMSGVPTRGISSEGLEEASYEQTGKSSSCKLKVLLNGSRGGNWIM